MSNSPMVLIVKDEPSLAQVLREYLEAAGFQTAWLDNGSDVQAWVDKTPPALIVLDLMLPGKDGLTLYRELRVRHDIPVVMATARVDDMVRSRSPQAIETTPPKQLFSRAKMHLTWRC